jgi:hypothetical protein
MVRCTHTLGTFTLSAHHRTRTNTNPNGTEANAVGIFERACIVRESKHFRRIMSYNFMAELSRHGSTHAFDWPSRKIAA